jgi:hypothetical protein
LRGAEKRENVGAYLRLGVPHGASQARDVLAQTLSNLILGRDGEGREELESADLGTPLCVALDNGEELLDDLGSELGRGETNELLGGLLGGVLDALELAGLLVAVEDDGEEGNKVRVGSAREANFSEQLLEGDHGALALVGDLALGGAGEVVENAVDRERAKTRLEDIGRKR